MFFPRNSFVTNTTLTHTNRPRQKQNENGVGNDHIACYGHHPESAQVTWHNSSGLLVVCRHLNNPSPCGFCGPRCRGNGAVGVDPHNNEHTDIHMFTDSHSYVNQDLECQVSSDQPAFIGVYLKKGGEHDPLLITLMFTMCTKKTRVQCYYNYNPVLTCCHPAMDIVVSIIAVGSCITAIGEGQFLHFILLRI